MAKSKAEMMARLHKERYQAGLKRLAIWATPEEVVLVKQYLAAIRAESSGQ